MDFTGIKDLGGGVEIRNTVFITVTGKAFSMSAILSKIKNQSGEAIFPTTLRWRFIQ
jgi:hypothetical protein